jgi:CRP-like cAMP-binding protein
MTAKRPGITELKERGKKVEPRKTARAPASSATRVPEIVPEEPTKKLLEGVAADLSMSSFDPLQLLATLSVGKTSREYLEEETIYSQGDDADAVFYIHAGKVTLTVVSKSGKEAVIALLPQECFFGEGCLAGQLFRMATATAEQKSSIIRVEKQVMIDLLHRYPQFAERFLGYMIARSIRMEADLVDHLFNSSEKRLARLLLLLANFGQESKPVPLIAKMSQETLAQMIGTTRSRVSFFLNRFRELGFIDYSGGSMQVHSSLVTVVLHD